MDLLKTILTVLGGILVLTGVVIVYAASKIVDKKKLDEKTKIDMKRVENLNEEGVKKFKRDSAILDVKLKGIMIAFPGAVILLVLLRK